MADEEIIEKKTYCVAVTALACVRQLINVEADDEEDAEKQAVEISKMNGDGGNWKLNGLYDDGGEYCKHSATETEEGEDSLDG